MIPKSQKMKKLDKRNIEDVLALTPMQEGMLFHYLKDPANDYYFEQLSLEISGEIDTGIFQEAWDFVIETNEMLRTVFQWEKVEKPMQVILKEHKLKPGYYDFPGEEGSQKKKKVEDIKIADRQAKFDLREVPFRVTLCKLEKSKYVMIISNHHILYDGWSNGIILKEFFRTYDDLVNGRELLNPVKTKFKEFVKWIQDQDKEKQEKFWQEYLSCFDTKTALSVKKRKGREITSTATDFFKISFSRELKDKIEDFVKCHRITLASLFYSAWGILLQQYNSNNDILLDTTVSGRNTKVKGIEEAVGLFINTLPLRVQTYPNERILDLLSRTDDMLQWWGDFKDSPRLEIKEHLDDYRQEYLFDSVLVIENYPLDRVLMQENNVIKVDSFSIFGISRYDLTAVIIVFADITIDFFYKKLLFDREIIEELADQFRYILKRIIEYPGEKAAALTISSENVRKKILARHIESPLLSVGGHVAPGNRVEEKLVDLWAQLFRIDKGDIGIDANFFDFGGHSLKASLLVTSIHKELQVKVPLVEIFQSPTIRQLARYINDRLPDNTSRPVKPEEKIKYPARVADLLNIHGPFPLTPIQSAYLMGRSDKFAIGGTSTHFYMEVNTRLDARRFNESLDKVISRHPLMCAIVTEDGKQKILKELPIYEIKVDNLTHLDAHEQEEWVLRERERMSHHIFDLSSWPLFEIKGLQFSHENLYLLVGFDAMIADRHSFQLIAHELDQYYRDPTIELPPLEFTFRDYVLAADEFRNSEVYAADREYWLKKLEYFPPAPRLPMVCNPSDIKKPRFKRLGKIFTGEEWITLQQVSRENNITPSILLCTAYAAVLAYWSNQSDFALNLTVFNRLPFHPHINEIVGNFTSLLLLEINWDQGNTFMEMARNLHRTLMEDLEHRHYDGVEFIREISRHKNLLNEAVMPVVFTSTVVEDREINFSLWDEMEDVRMSNGQTSQVFLDAHASLKKNRLEISWDFVTELFDPGTIQAIFSHYIGIITAIIEGDRDPKLQPPERDLVLWKNYNNTAEDIPPSLLHQIFKQQAAKTPRGIALEYEQQTMTYRQLDEKSNQVALYLKKQGVRANECIAVLTTRGFETIVNVMGILKAGGVYVPIEPDYPRERRDYIFQNSNCRLMLEPALYARENLARYPADDIENTNSPDGPAYVIYTSGSTGRPKGVVITHRQASNTIIDINRKFSVTEKDLVLGISSMCFDLSVYDVFGSLSSGARLVLIPTQKNVDILIDALDNSHITLWNSVPAILDMVVRNLEEDYVTPHLRCALLSGDWIPLPLPQSVKKHFPNCDVISLGGATEGSIWSIYYPVNEVRSQWKSIPYGYPLSNQDFYVLNDRLQLCPVEVPGELYIGGTGVAAGYLNDVEKTKNAFLHCPGFGKIYKTGDYGVFHRDGYIELLGRQDHQVKIRGYRVELGEIESCLLEHEQIKNAIVIDRTDSSGMKYLCAYIISDTKLDIPRLQGFLSRKLPHYMIPKFILTIDSIPLTSNGKINRKALPEPKEEINCEEKYETSQNETQLKLIKLMEEVLDGQKIGINDDFFYKGGDSLKANLLVARIRKEFNVKISLVEIFNQPTVKELAEHIEKAEVDKYASVVPMEKKEYYPLSPAQKRLYLTQQITPTSISYNLPQFFIFEGPIDRQHLEKIFLKLIKRHESLRTSFELVDDQPVQEIHENIEFGIEYFEIMQKKAFKDKSACSCSPFELDTNIGDFVRPFDLSQAPLLRLGLIKRGEEDHLFMVDMHHIIIDAISMRILIKEFKILYQRNKLPELKLQYRDFSEWQNRFDASEEKKKQEAYWLDEFAGELPRLNLDTDYEREAVQGFEGSTKRFALGNDKSEELRALSLENGTTLYVVVLSIFYVLLSKLTEQEDIIIGTAAYGRSHTDSEHIIGMFVNTLALRNYPKRDKSFNEFLQEVMKQTLKSFENQDYQFNELVNKLGIANSIERNPLFDVTLWFNSLDIRQQIEIPGLKITPYDYKSNTSKFDISITCTERVEDVFFEVEYNTKLFRAESIDWFIKYFKEILASIVANPGRKLSGINILSEEEKTEIIYQFNDELENE